MRSKIIYRFASTKPKEIDPIVLDEIFKKNKPVKRYRLIIRNNKLRSNETPNSTTRADQLKILDENLKKFKNAPINFNYYLRNIAGLKTSSQLPYKFGENQIITSDKNETLQKVLWKFNAPIRFAAGYGSGVFTQANQKLSESKPQMDMIYAVSYPDHWHALNLHQFPEHYSFLRIGGSGLIGKVQDLGAGVYFNPYVDMEGCQIKYGVTSMTNLMNDLINWDTFYLSGRLHKPINIMRNSPNIQLLNQFNLINAIKLSLLLNSDRGTEFSMSKEELFHLITSLSYHGDPRVQLGGESRDKVSNIVSGQYDKLDWMYDPLLRSYFADVVQFETDSTFKVNLSTDAKSRMIVDLPKSFRKKIYAKYADKYSKEFSEDIIAQKLLNPIENVVAPELSDLSFIELQTISNSDLSKLPIQDYEYISNNIKCKSSFPLKIAEDENMKQNLYQALKETIYRPAFLQSVKGIATAGVTKSIKYAWAKRKKYNSSTN
ncbi:hypothetical protein LJB42_002210 [Komagataella kurtzmanii]|nr:hypothetical protein LJB42_002210 [Komagataella kurtzmanii]